MLAESNYPRFAIGSEAIMRAVWSPPPVSKGFSSSRARTPGIALMEAPAGRDGSPRIHLLARWPDEGAYRSLRGVPGGQGRRP